jgi:hypothetical protein
LLQPDLKKEMRQLPVYMRISDKSFNPDGWGNYPKSD